MLTIEIVSPFNRERKIIIKRYGPGDYRAVVGKNSYRGTLWQVIGEMLKGVARK